MYHKAGAGGGGLSKPFDEFYTAMFIEDVSSGILPAGRGTVLSGSCASLNPPDDSTENIIVNALSTERYADSLSGSLFDFLRLTTAEVCAFDTATYEMAYLEDSETNQPVGFIFSFIDHEQIVRRRGKTFQFIDPSIAKERGVSVLIELPSEDLLIFEIPPEFRAAIADVRFNLSRLSRLDVATLALAAIEQKLPYDFSDHERSLHLALAEASKPLGWIARSQFRDQVLSYFWIRMHLTFKRFQIRLRESMIMALNQALKRAGKKIGFSGEIKVSGFPTVADVDRALTNLQTGSLPFTEVWSSLDAQ